MKTLEQIYKALEFHNDESQAFAYGITEVDGQLIVKKIGAYPDVYDLIQNIGDDKLQNNFDYFSLITYGWAAPLNKDGEVDGMPSQHPEKRRVQLIISVAPKQKALVGSSVKFQDDDEVIYDMGDATGSLADAMIDLIS